MDKNQYPGSATLLKSPVPPSPLCPRSLWYLRGNPLVSGESGRGRLPGRGVLVLRLRTPLSSSRTRGVALRLRPAWSRSYKVIWCLGKVPRRCSEAANSPCRIYPSYRQLRPTPCYVHRIDTKASVFRVLQYSIVPSLYQCCKLLNVLWPSALYSSEYVYRVFTILLPQRDYSLHVCN
jgi:hypothetical protein